MREIVIRRGVYGFRAENGRVQPVRRGEKTAVSDEEAERLVTLGVAVYAEQSESKRTPEPSELPSKAGPTPAVESAPDDAEVTRLERMSKADLERMARDLGVDISGAKNNRERALLIIAADDTDDETPDLEAGDIIQ